MSNATVLVTGGAGFIGSHVVELLLEQGHSVRVFDSLVEQVHQGAGPRYVPAEAEFVWGDVRDRESLAKALRGVDQVVHLAAEVGVGQSMYEVSRYVDANTGGTGVLLDIIANDKTDVGRIVVASSMSIYGEGAYKCPEHGLYGAQAAARVAAEGPPVGSAVPDLWRLGSARSRPAEEKALLADLGLRHLQDGPGAAVPVRRCRLRRRRRRTPLLQRLRAPSGAVQSLHRCGRHLLRSAAQRPRPPGVRGRPAAAGLHPCP